MKVFFCNMNGFLIVFLRAFRYIAYICCILIIHALIKYQYMKWLRTITRKFLYIICTYIYMGGWGEGLINIALFHLNFIQKNFFRLQFFFALIVLIESPSKSEASLQNIRNHFGPATAQKVSHRPDFIVQIWIYSDFMRKRAQFTKYCFFNLTLSFTCTS